MTDTADPNRLAYVGSRPGDERSTHWRVPPVYIEAAARVLGERGEFGTDIVLFNNATETKRVQLALREGAAVCFVRGRIAFLDADGVPQKGNPRGQLFVLFGAEHLERFRTEFGAFGYVAEL